MAGRTRSSVEDFSGTRQVSLTRLLYPWQPAGATDGRALLRDTIVERCAPLSGLWITLAPLFFQHGEFSFERLPATVSHNGSGAGWDTAAVQAVVRRMDRHTVR